MQKTCARPRQTNEPKSTVSSDRERPSIARDHEQLIKTLAHKYNLKGKLLLVRQTYCGHCPQYSRILNIRVISSIPY